MPNGLPDIPAARIDMKRPLIALLCIAAGLAGWGGMAWRQESAAPGKLAAASALPPPAAAKAPAISRTADALQLARSLDATAEDSRAKLLALPPGAARDLAVALYDSRFRAAKLARQKAAGATPAEDNANPFAELPPGFDPGKPSWEHLRERMLSGIPKDQPAADADPFGDSPSASTSLDLRQVSGWAALDPAAASEAILNMPAGEERGAAVNAAAKVMALSDPQAAWDLIIKSAETKLSMGARETLKLAAAKDPQAPARMASMLTASQRDSLAGALSKYHLALHDLGQTPTGEDLRQAVMAAQALPETEGRRKLAEWLANEDLAALREIAGTGPPDVSTPEGRILATRDLLAKLDPQHPEGTATLQALGTASGGGTMSPEALNATAAQLLPQLAASGHLAEAVQILPRITDSNARRETLEKLLPQWMDADPAAARAAFNAAPFTTLERERWQQHPSFLLNPEREGASP